MKPTITYKELVLNEEFYLWVKYGKNDDYWKEWAINHPENEESLTKAREVILHLNISSEELSSQKKTALWARIERSNQKVSSGNRSVYWGMRVAASLVILALSALAITLYIQNHSVDHPKMITKSNPRGQKSTFHLPDGSTVTLNAGSELRYSNKFGIHSRHVQLSGEAFFEVRKDPSQPFTVTTDHLKTTVLGTTFNVSAYPEQDQVAVMLASGRVRVTGISDKFNGLHYLLHPGDQLVYKKREQLAAITSFQPEQAIGWKDGILSFTDTPMKEVVWRLEMWYDVKILLNIEHAENYHFTGKFKNQSLDHVLEGISYSFGFQYELKNRNVTIYQ